MKVIEQTARASYGKLLAILTKTTSGDIALAEDCLSSAFVKALEVWPKTAVPSNPEGWLVTTAKNLMRDRKRHEAVRDENVETLLSLLAEKDFRSSDHDNRLELLFACSHPAIDPSVRVPLMLQTVMGFSVDQIASMFLMSPAAIEKRLTRAKQKIKLARIPFDIPTVQEMPDRLSEVLEGIYALFGKSWDDFSRDLEDEAMFLAGLVVDLLPDEPEPKGLLALLSFSSSRKLARRIDGQFVPFSEQNPALWDKSKIDRAEALLKDASTLGRPGRFQYEAAIQSAQIAQVATPADTREHVLNLYKGLLETTDSAGARVAFAAALLRMGRVEAASDVVSQLDLGRIGSYQPYWVLMGEIQTARGDSVSARRSIETAIGLTSDLAVKNFLFARLNQLA